MKRTLLASLVALTGLLIVSGCATSDSQTQKQAAKPAEQAKDNRPPEQRLKAGMTKDEVRQALGNPAGESANSDGTQSWRYSDSAKAFIPFYHLAGGKIQVIIVNFDKDGKVKDWSSNSQGLY